MIWPDYLKAGINSRLVTQEVEMRNNKYPLATQAMKDLIELTVLSKDVPASDHLLEKHFKLSMPVLVM